MIRIPTLEFTQPPSSLEDKLTELLNEPVTPRLLQTVRALVRDEQNRLLQQGIGDTAERFWVCFHRKDARVDILGEGPFREMIAKWYDEPMLLSVLPAHVSIEEVERLARLAGWEVV